MSGDYSRDTFEELRRYAALRMQQGRVLLDADFNEMVDILKTRIEKLSLDALGNPGYSLQVSPGAFEVSLVPGPQPDLALSPGRVYIDGKMAEIFDGETVTYTGQPFYPEPPDLPVGDAAVYLELWEEELTWVEAPLLDPALGGVDTTTRLRTNFRLHVEGVQAAECGLDVGPPPSAGRLTTRAVAVPAPDDPCILPPGTGYRATENRFYRVEVHEAGPLGTARFKWSRDNGSIVSLVRLMADNGGQIELTVDRIGRDPVLRFSPGDWVTVTDDHREWMDEPGEMARVAGIDEAAGTILLESAIPQAGTRAFGANPDELEARHTRIQKWDQTGATNTLDPEGLILTGPGPIPIDDVGVGIEIEFSVDPAGGNFRRGDYWTFWARTATAEILELTDAPPDGIERHYVQLAAASDLGGPNPVVSNCRPVEETSGEGCCTVIVHPGESIQAAIDALPPQGGCVCIKAGQHTVPDTITIARANVHMHGESPGAILRGAAPLLRIDAGSAAVRIDMLDFVGRAPIQQLVGIVEVQGAQDVTIADCRIEGFTDIGGGVGILATFATRLTLLENQIARTNFGIVVQDYSPRPIIRGNTLSFGAAQVTDTADVGIWVGDVIEPAMIDGNMVSGAHLGIVVSRNPFGAPVSIARDTSVTDNLILTGAGSGQGDQVALGIDMAAEYGIVRGNVVLVAASNGVGIRVTGSGCLVNGNILSAPGALELPAFGIQLGYDGETGSAVADIRVSDNQLDGRMHGIVTLRAVSPSITGNTLLAVEGVPVFGILTLDTPQATISDNRIEGSFVALGGNAGRETRIAGNDVSRAGAGVLLFNDLRPKVSDNRLTGCTALGAVAALTLGRTEFTGNRVANAGVEAPRAVALGAFGIFGEWHVQGNEVLDTGVAPDGSNPPNEAWGIWGDLILQARVEGNLVTYADPFSRDVTREDRALLMRGLLEVRFVFGAGERLVFGYPVQILGNSFSGNGAGALVQLLDLPLADQINARFERVFFSDNYCLHVAGDGSDNRATVDLVGRGCTVTGNQVKATNRGFFSFNFNGMRGPFADNVTSGGTLGYAPFAPAPDGQNNFILV
ncbi:MAG: hypothetical protein GYB50_21740 [Rhodobacteraceae bacterium]|nr:hypothetical protein [Paracoccaceae bacterium]